MNRRATPKLIAYLSLVACCLIAAVAVGRPELVVVATPFVVALIAGLAGGRELTAIDAAVDLERGRALEGETVSSRLHVHGQSGRGLVDVAVVLPDGLDVAPDAVTFAGIAPTTPADAELQVVCRHWGGYANARVAMRVRQAEGFFVDERVVDVPFEVRVYPRADRLRSLVAPLDTRPSAGNLVTRKSGAGIEFADLRPFQVGDELRHVNWRASARRGSVWVNSRHPEQNADVILFLDTFADVRDGRSGTLDLTVRAAAAAARRYLLDHARVGVVGFGGTLRWLEPDTGDRQLYRIVETLITTSLAFSYAWKDVSTIPAPMMPPHALILAITPLVDPRGIGAVYDLLRRRLDVSIIAVSPERFLPPAGDRPTALALRLWRLERDELIGQLRETGGAVSAWDGDRSLDVVLEEVIRFRRRAIEHAH